MQQKPPNPPLPKGGMILDHARIGSLTFGVVFSFVFAIPHVASQNIVVDGGVPDRIATMLNPEENPIFASAFHNLSFSPNGRLLAVGQGSGDVLLWRTSDWTNERRIKAHGNWAFSVIFSAKSDTFFTGGGDNLIKVWRLANTDNPTLTLSEHGMDVHALALTPSETHLVSAGDDMTPIVWDLQSGKPERRLTTHPKQVTAVAVDPDGRTIATASRDSKVRLFDFKTGELQFTLEGHERDVMSVRFSPSGHVIASASYDGTVCLWDVDMGYLIERLAGHNGAAVCLDFSPDGRHLVSVDHRRLTFLEADDLKAPQVNLEPELADGEQMSFVRFSPDGKTIAVTTTAARVLLIDAERRQVTQNLTMKSTEPAK